MNFNLNTGIITLHFDEPVIHTSVDVTDLTLADSATANITYDILNAGTRLTNQFSTDYQFQLTDNELLTIKATIDLADSMDTTYLNFTSALARDATKLQNLLNASLVSEEPLLVAIYVPDTVLPTLVSYVVVDLNAGTTTYQFSEPVNIDTFQASGFTLQSTASASPSQSYTLTAGGNIVYENEATKTTLILTFK